jgi:hypothetical protein
MSLSIENQLTGNAAHAMLTKLRGVHVKAFDILVLIALKTKAVTDLIHSQLLFFDLTNQTW